jgi:hypothetical protein
MMMMVIKDRTQGAFKGYKIKDDTIREAILGPLEDDSEFSSGVVFLEKSIGRLSGIKIIIDGQVEQKGENDR